MITEELPKMRCEDRQISRKKKKKWNQQLCTLRCPRVSLLYLCCLGGIVAIYHLWGHSKGKAWGESEKLDW